MTFSLLLLFFGKNSIGEQIEDSLCFNVQLREYSFY